MRKSIVCNWVVLACLAVARIGGVCRAQPIAIQPVQQSPSIGGDYAITQVGPHSRVWRNSAGQSVNEIATGMNFWNGTQWTPSDPSFAVSTDGSSFVATKIQDPTQLAANINSQGAVTVVTPDGVTLRSTPVAIGLYDAASGLSVVVAAITNSTGVMVDAQHMVYTNAFVGGGFTASVVYSLPDAGSFRQDVVFTGFTPKFDPTVWGFAANSTNTLQIQIFTEFYGVPQPQMQERQLYIEQDPNVRASMVSPDVIDYTLDFGHYVFGPGRAYTASTSAGPSTGVTVAKNFVTSSGRTFLVESIPFRSIAGMLQSLPPVTVRTASLKHFPGATRMKVAAASVPPLRDVRNGPREKITPGKAVAAAVATPRGVTVDYIVTVSSLNEPKVYGSDSTFFVSGPVYESSAVTMEACVFKFPTSAGYIEIENSLTMATTNYRTAIFTSADDGTAGATLSTTIWSGYTGTPSSDHYGSVGLWLNTSSSIALNNVRFCYMNLAVQINADTAGQTVTLSHSQWVDCREGIYVDGGNGSNTNSATLTFDLYNCLMANVGLPLEVGGVVLTASAINCTIDSSTDLIDVDVGTTTTGSINFTNSIFSSLAAKGTLGSVSLGGVSDLFYNSSGATFGSYNTLTSSPYQSSVAGHFYLPSTNSVLTNGSTNIPPVLLSQLQIKTTAAPLGFYESVANNTILTPIVPRDTAGNSIGFHYNPIDFVVFCGVGSGVTLTLTNGVALAYYNSAGIALGSGSKLISQGSPNSRNYLVYYNLVQEQPVSYDPAGTADADPIVPAHVNPAPSLFLRLTTICAPTGETNLFNTGDLPRAAQSISGLTLQDCEIYGSGANWQMSEGTATPTVELTNNVFYRVPFAVNSQATITSINNLFYGTTNTNEFAISILHQSGSSANTHENNVFDGVTASLDGTVGHNAYVHGATNTVGGTSTDITNTLIWQAGPLGSFYQPATSPLLNNGSASAASLGLYHYTVLTSEAVEGSSTVSIGYHYMALASGGFPLDTNNDGVPDYLEDANGDGITDNGETNWSSSTLPWIGTQPINQYAVAGTPATFSVTAYGSGGLSYQWQKNGGNIIGANSSSYTIPSVSSGDVASYSVAVSGITSSSATLTLVVSPQLSGVSPTTNGLYWLQTIYEALSPVVANANYGSATSVYYSQILDPYLRYASGYQWRYNGSNITSATGPTYVPTFDGGTNTVVITNAVGTTNVTWTNVFLAAPGMVEAWGSDGSGECNRPTSLMNVVAIAAGGYQSIAVTDTGSVVQWGQYYNGSTFYPVGEYSFSTPPPSSGVVAVAAGLQQGLALMANGTVYGWGLSNAYVGILSTNPSLSNITAIACGWQFNLALSNGTVIAWGTNAAGQTAVPAYLTNVVAIAAGATHSLALQSNGTVIAWGTQSSGSTNVPPLTNAVAIAAGENHNLVLQSNGMVVAWGDNSYNQCTIPAAASQGNVTAIAAGDNFSMALLNTGTIVEWGYNAYGQTNVPQSNPTNPVNVKLVAAGGNHAMAGIWSPLVQYPINVSKDLLLIYNSNSVDSWNVCEYYRTNRPMVSAANELPINCTTNETISPSAFTTSFVPQVQQWLINNPTKRPQYVILFPDIPSRVNTDLGPPYTNLFNVNNEVTNVQCQLKPHAGRIGIHSSQASI